MCSRVLTQCCGTTCCRSRASELTGRRRSGGRVEATAMRTRGRHVIALGVLALSAMGAVTMPGFTAPAPNPSLTITTYLPGGMASPVTGVTGSWTLDKSGRSAHLSLSGVIASGMSTIVRASWTSGWVRPRRGEIASFSSGMDQNYPVDTSPTSTAIDYRYRTKGSGWSQWMKTSSTHEPGLLLVNEGDGFGSGELVDPSSAPKVLQVEFRISDTLTATGTVSQTVDVVAG
jgi:hypothetical protein